MLHSATEKEVSTTLLEARRVLEKEARAIDRLKDKLGSEFERAIEFLLQCKGKVVFTGIGKSGIIARKISSTLSSTGTPSIFLHLAESTHGDMGILDSNDVIVAISNSGKSNYFSHLLKFASRKGIPIISIVGSPDSPLAKASNVFINIDVEDEACPLGLAPTTSTTVTLALGDAIAMALLKRKGFKEEDFAEFHPSGHLGFRLLTRVKDLMHGVDSLPLVHEEKGMRDVISVMTSECAVKGVAGVVDDVGNLVGIITDGQVRRALTNNEDPLIETASNVMSRSPKVIDLNELAEKSLFEMNKYSIQVLFVIDHKSSNPKKPVGILHIHDVLRAQAK